MTEEMCEKCGKLPVSCFHSSTKEKTLGLCENCDKEYEEFMRQKKNEFLGKEFFEKPYIIEPLKYDKRKGIYNISKGDKLKCLNCGKTIEVNEKSFVMDSEAEYIKCPHCKSDYDVQYYHLYGEKIDEKD